MSDAAPETFAVFLGRLRHQEVRAIVAALGLGRRATENQKGAWIAAMAAAWLDPTRQAPFLDRLSPAAHGALWRLWQGAPLPRELVLADYGAIRLPGDNETAADSAPPPWPVICGCRPFTCR